MSIGSMATGLFNHIKNVDRNDGYLFTALTTAGGSLIGGAFGGAEGAMAAGGIMAAANASTVGLNALHNVTKDYAAKKAGALFSPQDLAILEGQIGKDGVSAMALGSETGKGLEKVKNIGARTAFGVGEVLNDNLANLNNRIVKPTVSSAKKGMGYLAPLTHREEYGVGLTSMGITAAGLFGASFSAGGMSSAGAAASAMFVGGMAASPIINKIAETANIGAKLSAIKQAGIINSAKAGAEITSDMSRIAGSYVFKGNKGVVDKSVELGPIRSKKAIDLMTSIADTFRNN